MFLLRLLRGSKLRNSLIFGGLLIINQGNVIAYIVITFCTNFPIVRNDIGKGCQSWQGRVVIVVVAWPRDLINA